MNQICPESEKASYDFPDPPIPRIPEKKYSFTWDVLGFFLFEESHVLYHISCMALLSNNRKPISE